MAYNRLISAYIHQPCGIYFHITPHFQITASAQKTTLVLGLHGEPIDGFDPVMGWGRYGNPLFSVHPACPGQ